MANRRPHRKKNRSRQNRTATSLPLVAPKPDQTPKPSKLRTATVVLWGLIGSASTLLGLTAISSVTPKVTVYPAAYKSNNEPTRSSFTIENQGMFALHKVMYGFRTVFIERQPGNLEVNNVAGTTEVIGTLKPDEKTTVDMLHLGVRNAPIQSAVIEAHITYRSSFCWWRSNPQRFPFRADRIADGSFVWSPVSQSEIDAIDRALADIR